MPSLIPRSLSTKEQRNGEGSGNIRSHLFLNVYDLTPINNYLYWVGLGIFHTGIEVHGMEYGFGAHDYATSGVFEVEPKCCPGFIFRRSVWLGATDMSRAEFRMFIEQLSGKYFGDTYHLIAKNCNHFTDDVCLRLTGKPIPGWVLFAIAFCLKTFKSQLSDIYLIKKYYQKMDQSLMPQQWRIVTAKDPIAAYLRHPSATRNTLENGLRGCPEVPCDAIVYQRRLITW